MKEGQSCGKCIHWLRKDENGGECRRNPPQIAILQEQKQELVRDIKAGALVPRVTLSQRVQGFFPMTKAEDLGCGEYREIQSHENI